LLTLKILRRTVSRSGIVKKMFLNIITTMWQDLQQNEY
jgi:hypothetical protein